MMMTGSNYPAHFEELSRRYDEALSSCGFDTLLIYSGAPIRRFADDYEFPFRCYPHFRSLVPVSQAHSWIVYRTGKVPQLLFYLPRDYWHFVAPLPQDFWTGHFELVPLTSPEGARTLLPTGQQVAVLGDCNTEQVNWKLGSNNPSTLTALLDWERAYKTDYERDCMREASRIAALGHLAAEAAFREGRSEYEINLAYMQATGQDSEIAPYGNIVALNEHSAILHYTERDAEPLPAEGLRSFLIDAGADCNGFASDITRTYAYSDGPFADLIASFDLHQQAIVNSVQAGASYVDLHLLTHHKVATTLSDAGILKCSAESAVESNLTSTFMPHGLGHQLGLQVHDVGGHQAAPEGGDTPPPALHPHLRNTRTIECKQVFTIEPGLYFIDTLLEDLRNVKLGKEVDWALIDLYRPFGGIRIEDDIMVLDEGVENFTRNAFAALP